MWKLAEEPTGDTYRRLVDYAMHECHEFCLVHRGVAPDSNRVLAALDRLSPLRTEVEETDTWPGTQVCGATATVYWHRCSPAAVGLLVSLCSRMYAWIEPKRPEDLSFVKPGREPWLITIAHERESWLTDAVDLPRFRSEFPRVKLRGPGI